MIEAKVGKLVEAKIAELLESWSDYDNQKSFHIDNRFNLTNVLQDLVDLNSFVDYLCNGIHTDLIL